MEIWRSFTQIVSLVQDTANTFFDLLLWLWREAGGSNPGRPTWENVTTTSFIKGFGVSRRTEARRVA